MQLVAPCQSINFRTKDIFGDHFQLSELAGKRVVLSFFRDAACPFCNYRIYELTQKYKQWKDSGLEVVVVFSDSPEQVRKHVAKRPRPFKMISDPKLKLYNSYGVEQSALALFKALLFNFPEIIKGLLKGGRPSNNPHIKIVPADFLIDVNGEIVETWYGKTTADHIPMQKLMTFGSQKEILNSKELHAELERLRKENAALKSR